MINNFKKLQQEDEQRVPKELEQHVMAQASHVRMIMDVAGIFGPQAARAAVRVMGGWHDTGQTVPGNSENAITDAQYWRLPPDLKP